MNDYYKLIAIRIDAFESKIIDEINIGNLLGEDYRTYIKFVRMCKCNGYLCIKTKNNKRFNYLIRNFRRSE